MTKAFLDTTIIADALLKEPERSKAARSAISRFDWSLLPVYAIKEFRGGPLKHFVWVHNKLAAGRSLTKALRAVHSSSMSPRRYQTSTAIEALILGFRKASSRKLDKGTLDECLGDQLRLILRRKIHSAWRDRRGLASETVQPLSCYKEPPLEYENGQIAPFETRCRARACCLREAINEGSSKVGLLIDAMIATGRTGREHDRRLSALKELRRKPKQAMSENHCRDLGDAYFALFAPDDSVILTTNPRDHEILAACLGKVVEVP